jgi:Family of unknown function (DUF6194)
VCGTRDRRGIIRLAKTLPGVVVVTAGPDNGAPEVAWGDSFGFDTSSNLYRPGVFRLNVGVGRQRFEALLGYPPSQHAAHSAGVDYAVLDQVIPHPEYAAQGWVAILCPADEGRARELIEHGYERVAAKPRATRTPRTPGAPGSAPTSA